MIQGVHILSHLIGDFLLQNDWMAKHKKESSLICFIHAACYMIPFLLFCNLSLMQSLLIGLQHFIQDRTYIVNYFMTIAGKSEFAKPPLSPWSIFVVDNTFHLLFIQLILMFVI